MSLMYYALRDLNFGLKETECSINCGVNWVFIAGGTIRLKEPVDNVVVCKFVSHTV